VNAAGPSPWGISTCDPTSQRQTQMFRKSGKPFPVNYPLAICGPPWRYGNRAWALLLIPHFDRSPSRSHRSVRASYG